jgi:hypothetical protein
LPPAPPNSAKKPNAGAFALATTVEAFLRDGNDAALGALTQHAARVRYGVTENEQIIAWMESLEWLRAALTELERALPTAATWTICLEYDIPRRSSRIDAVLIARDVLFVVEFKSTRLDASALRQIEDYALELLDFHKASHSLRIIPIACAARTHRTSSTGPAHVNPPAPATTTPSHLSSTLESLFAAYSEAASPAIDASSWLSAPYEPTPSIIEAARAIYSGHSIADISRAEAARDQLARTTAAVYAVAAEAFRERRRAICFITGVPGAGKTLAGLNIAHHPPMGMNATFLTGNAPLVDVLTGLLKRESRERRGATDSNAARASSTLVTNVHKWIDGCDANKSPPYEHLIVFDEAQRAWNREHSYRKFKRAASEPELLLQIMERHEHAVVVALVGSGQEINTGEGGLSEWGRALAERHTNWRIALAPGLIHDERESHGQPLIGAGVELASDRIAMLDDLHLGVSRRSFRSRYVTEWVNHVIGNQPLLAAHLMEKLGNFPIVMTRDLERAKGWLRERARGLRRSGLIASSGARRLRPHGIAVREQVDAAEWFLAPPDDVRSSSFLELALTEFGIQGLEIDWAGIAWDCNLMRSDDGADWAIRAFRGSKWVAINDLKRRRYTLNTYRVLLTRAREGMVIWLPPGDERDPTRDPRRYNALWNYFTACGVRSI